MTKVVSLAAARQGEPSLFVDDVFDAVASLPTEEREAALQARCAGHPSVETEVRALLAIVDSTPEPNTKPLVVELGAELGRYRLEERLGAGATASVWRAFDTQLRSWTALKLLHPQVRATHALEAVMTEARAASRIISDHVVRIKSAGQFGEQLHYIDMELCAEHRPDDDGHERLDVGQSLAEAPLRSLDEVLRVVAEAARGVDAAHRVGVLHRDVKPANILLTPVSRRALVTDFGLAAPHLFPTAGPDTPADATVTMAAPAGDGKLVGTPCYMPPEQAHGLAPVRASDVYSLGATLYALLSGQAPYQPRDLPPRPALETVLRVREEAPADVREVQPDVPQRLARIVRKAMARDPHDRYATAAELAADLDSYRAGRATSQDQRRPLLRTQLWLRRHRTAVVTGSVMASLVVAMVVGAVWLGNERRMLLEAAAWSDARSLESDLEAEAAAQLERLAQARRQDAEEASAEAARRAAKADRDRVQALRSESDAERRWALERAAREAAVSSQEEALALATVADEARRSAEEANAALEEAMATSQALRQRLEEQVDDLGANKAQVEAALRSTNLENVELQLAAERANERVAQLQHELDRVTYELTELRDQLSALSREPLPAPPQPEAPEEQQPPG